MDDYENEEERIEHLFEELIRPQIEELQDRLSHADAEEAERIFSDPDILSQMMPEDVNIGDSEATIFVSHDQEAAQETIQKIQEHLGEGLSLDYILNEMTNAQIGTRLDKQVGDMPVHIVEINPGLHEDAPNLSADDLKELFER